MSSIRRALPRLILAQVCLHAVLTGLRLAAPLWALRQADSALLAGALVSLFSVSQVLLSLPAGRFVDRHGLRKPLGLAVLLASGGALLATAWPGAPTLALAALACGAGSGLAVIALQRHLGQLASSAGERRELFSWLALGPSLSNVLGPLLAGVLIDWAGFRAAFAALALLPALGWLALGDVDDGARPGVASSARAAGGTRALLRLPGFKRLLAINWLLATCWDVHTFLIPVLGHERGYAATTIGALLSTFALATALVRVVMPWLAQRLRERAVLAAALAASGLLLAVFPLLRAPLALGVCSALLGVALGAVQPMVMSALHHLVPPARIGEALGFRLMVVNGSSVAMPLLFGAAGAAVGASSVFWLIGGAALLGTLLTRRLVTDEAPRS